MILQATKPWMSDRDLDSGVSWSAEIAKQLDESSVGIICVTPERMSAPWLLFESGAIAKKLEDARVIPYLIDLSPTQLTGPLSQFQAREANKEGTLRVLLDINSHLPEPRGEEEVRKMFGSFWGQLEEIIKAQIEAGNSSDSQSTARSDKEILDEVLLLVRENAREIAEMRRVIEMQPTPLIPGPSRRVMAQSFPVEPGHIIEVPVVNRARVGDFLISRKRGEDFKVSHMAGGAACVVHVDDAIEHSERYEVSILKAVVNLAKFTLQEEMEDE